MVCFGIFDKINGSRISQGKVKVCDFDKSNVCTCAGKHLVNVINAQRRVEFNCEGGKHQGIQYDLHHAFSQMG